MDESERTELFEGAAVAAAEPAQAREEPEAGVTETAAQVREETESIGALEEAVETAGVAEEAANPEAQWKRRAEAYAARAVFSEARAAAAALGVPESRLDYAARLADVSGIDPEGEGAREVIAQAVRAVLKDLPELRGGAGTGQTASARRPRRDAFEKGFLGE